MISSFIIAFVLLCFGAVFVFVKQHSLGHTLLCSHDIKFCVASKKKNLLQIVPFSAYRKGRTLTCGCFIFYSVDVGNSTRAVLKLRAVQETKFLKCHSLTKRKTHCNLFSFVSVLFLSV